MSSDVEAAGALATAGLAASAIDPGRPHRSGHGSACANCDTGLTGAFCHACGQSAHLHRSVGHVVEEFLHGVWHFDSKSWRTLPLLAFSPGRLTWDYIHGKRARYVAPLALFLLSVFLMFFVFGLVGGPDLGSKSDGVAKVQVEIGKARAGDDARAAKLTTDGWKTELAAAAKSGELDVNTGSARINENIRKALENPDFAIYRVQQKAYKLSFLLVPLSLPLLWLLFCWRRDVTIYDHTVFALYSLSFMSLLFIVLALLGKIGDSFSVPALASLAFFLALTPPIHMYAQLKGAYRLSVAGALVRTVILTVGSVLTLAGFLAIIVVLGLAD